MKPLTFRFPDSAKVDLNLLGIVPNRVRDLDLSAIQQLPIEVGGKAAAIGEHCEIADGAREEIHFEGDLSRAHQVGGEQTDGRLVVLGSVGDALAARMTGGFIEVRGSAGRFAGGNLRGGVVDIAGDCGEYAASAAPGQKRGMSGGTLVIRGNCDKWLATRMRRGTVIVHGQVAAASAYRMIAGTLAFCGKVELPLGTDMSRGTILMLGKHSPCVAPPGFTAPEVTELSFIQILMNDIAQHLPLSLRPKALPETVMRSIGDRVHRGLGEIIWMDAQVRVADSILAHA